MNFNICAVHRADCYRAVDHKLHIARARRFFAGDTDLFGNFRSGHHNFGKRHAIVFQKYHFEFIVYRLIVIDDFAELTDKSDDLLRHIITACRLCAEDESARADIQIRIIL